MPDKPLWLDRLPEAVRQLELSTEPWVDRPALELLLGVGRRRAQQLLAPIAVRRVGTSVVAKSADLIAHLRPGGTIPGILYAKDYPAFDSSPFCTLSVPRRSARSRCKGRGLTQIPDVIAGQVDVFPAKRRKVG